MTKVKCGPLREDDARGRESQENGETCRKMGQQKRNENILYKQLQAMQQAKQTFRAELSIVKNKEKTKHMIKQFSFS